MIRITMLTGFALLTVVPAVAQMMAEMDSAETTVRGFSSETTPVATRAPMRETTTATLRGAELMGKAPARLQNSAKPTSWSGGAAKGTAYLETRVLQTGIDAREFLQVISPTLGKNLTAKQVDSTHVAVTGTTEALRRTTELSEQIRAAMKRPARQVQLRAALLMDQKPESDTTGTAISLRDLTSHLPEMDLTNDDVIGTALPEKLWLAADLTAPASGGGENRVLLSDRFTLLYELRETLAGDYEFAVNLAEKEKGANPFDAGPGRVIFANRFRANTTRPVLLGITTPARTLILVVRLKSL